MYFCSKFINQIFINFCVIIIITTNLFNIIRCIESIPNQIKKNYFQLNHLSSGKTEILDNNNIICSYNTEFSNRIISNKKNIICLENYQYIYIINNADTYLYKFNLGNVKDYENHLNLIPYSFNNNIFFIISYINNNDNLNMTLYQVKIKENKCDKINTKVFEKKEITSFKYLLNCTVSANDYTNSNLFLCFFLDQRRIHSFTFDIDRQFSIINISNATCQDCHEREYYSYYSDISINQEKNTIFLCYKINTNKKTNYHCFFYYISNNYFKENKQTIICEKYLKNYYFSETNEYSIICQNEGTKINMYTLSENNIENNYVISTINIGDFNCKKADNFFLYLNSSKKEYNLINDCDNYHNFIYLSNTSYSKYKLYNINAYTGEVDHLRHLIPRNLYYTVCRYNYFEPNLYSLNDTLSNLNVYQNDLSSGTISGNNNYCIKKGGEEFIELPEQIFPNISITTLLIEIEISDPNSLINKMAFRFLFDDNFTEIDLSNNKTLKGRIIYKLKENKKVNKTKVSYFKNNSVNIFNSTDIFFNELCHVYPDLKDDIIMEDRIKEYLNFTICEPGCSYVDIDVDVNNTVTCECSIEDIINTTIRETKHEFKNKYLGKTISNFEIWKCIKLVFSPDDKINNLGFWIFTFVLGVHVPLWLHYINSGVKPIQKFILDSMTEYGYIIANKNTNKKKIIKKKNIKKTIDKSKRNSKKNVKAKIKVKGAEDNNNNNDINYQKTSMPPPKNNIAKKSSKNNGDEISKKKTKKKFASKSRNNLIGNIIENNIGKGIKIQNRNNKKATTSWKKKTQNNYNTIIFTSNEVINKNTVKKKKKISKKNINVDDTRGDKSQNILNANPEEYEFNDFNEEDYLNEKIGINLININVNSKARNIVPNESNKILNNYTFQEAIQHDHRSFFRIFYIFILSKQIIFHLFALKTPLELMSVRAFVVLFVYSSHLAFNSLFYLNSHVSKKYYSEEGLLDFTFHTNMPIIFLSCFLSVFCTIVITKLSNPMYSIREIFKKEEDKLKSDKTYTVTLKRKEEIHKEVEQKLESIKNKFLALFIVEIIIMLLFWYHLTAFGHIYSNTQYSWILNSAISIVFHFIIECLFCFIFAIFYRISINNKINCLYNFVMFFYNFI